MKIDKKLILLRFQDRGLEEEFRHFYEIETMPTIRLGMIFSFVIIVVLTTFAYYFTPANFFLWLSLYSLVFIYLAFIVYATLNHLR